MSGSVTLVLGGTRSGKSAVAEGLATELDTLVTYVATARVDREDADHRARIDAHRERRPTSWRTVECPDVSELATVLADIGTAVLLDSIGTWVAGHADITTVDPGPLVDALAARTAPTIVVSDEVGLAVHAPTELGRAFVDAMGIVNQRVSAIADRALLVVAGRTLDLPDNALAAGSVLRSTDGATRTGLGPPC